MLVAGWEENRTLMELEVRTLQLSKNSWASELSSRYIRKIVRFEKINFKNIKDEKKWLAGVESKDIVCACDERAQSLSSKEFAKKIETLRDGGTRKLIFYIGGPFGLPEEVLSRANLKLTLSPFVLNQEIALTVLMEQIFRAYTIINNHPYHNE